MSQSFVICHLINNCQFLFQREREKEREREREREREKLYLDFHNALFSLHFFFFTFYGGYFFFRGGNRHFSLHGSSRNSPFQVYFSINRKQKTSGFTEEKS